MEKFTRFLETSIGVKQMMLDMEEPTENLVVRKKNKNAWSNDSLLVSWPYVMRLYEASIKLEQSVEARSQPRQEK